MAAGSAAEVPSVAKIARRLRTLLATAKIVKPERTLEPPLPRSEITADADALLDDLDCQYDQTYRFNAAEAAVRQIFHELLESASIEDAAFGDVWNLLDILIICGDNGRCGPELVCHLIEELLDSQTTAGCRIVFDYLESRTSRLAAKDFHKKNLVFLRSCNELLRRLSRAEDAIFCGRVFFFLFQTFPLGDKSSVNLRGEFHVENTTKFEASQQDIDKMDVDIEPSKNHEALRPRTAEIPQPPGKSGQKAPQPKPTKKPPEELALSNDELYPIFWRLQRDFSDPTRLFSAGNFANFKTGLNKTLIKFKKTPTFVQTKADADNKRGVKRKLSLSGENGDPQEHFADNYNPKYLTSRDLFDLEISDLAFQRHIMVQALILIDFLLSLTEKAKKKLATAPEATNKSLLYTFTLGPDDAKWCTDTRAAITDYLQLIPTLNAGRFYHRMVETILARDKNWVRWKIESCPSIVRDPVSVDMELEARTGARNATRTRRMPNRLPGTTDLSFLEEGEGGGLEALKYPARWALPSQEELVDGIRTDRLDLEMSMDSEETATLENAINSKTWRLTRHLAASDLRLLDKVDPTTAIEDVFKPLPTPPLEDNRRGDTELVEIQDEEDADTAEIESAVKVKDADEEKDQVKPMDDDGPEEIGATP